MRGMGFGVAALVCIPLMVKAAERRPTGSAAPGGQVGKPGAQAAAAPAAPVLPTHQVDEMGYPTVEATMHALSQRPDLRVSVQGFFLNYDDPDHKLVWSFPVRGVMAYPSVVRRQVVTGPKGTEVQMAIVCEAPQPVCQTFAGEFMKLNGLMAERLNAQAGAAPAPAPGPVSVPVPVPVPPGKAP